MTRLLQSLTGQDMTEELHRLIAIRVKFTDNKSVHWMHICGLGTYLIVLQ